MSIKHNGTGNSYAKEIGVSYKNSMVNRGVRHKLDELSKELTCIEAGHLALMIFKTIDDDVRIDMLTLLKNTGWLQGVI
jgi:hypothetical protein